MWCIDRIAGDHKNRPYRIGIIVFGVRMPGRSATRSGEMLMSRISAVSSTTRIDAIRHLTVSDQTLVEPIIAGAGANVCGPDVVFAVMLRANSGWLLACVDHDSVLTLHDRRDIVMI